MPNTPSNSDSDVFYNDAMQNIMSEKQSTAEIDELKTTGLDRHLSIAKTSLNIGKRWASNSISSLFLSKEEKETRNLKFREEQAAYFVAELGKLKGSVVKIGQMLAMYGEHFLPQEITTALHQLNDNTASLSWSVVEQTLKQQLGSKLADLEVHTTPIGTASLGQVHRATIKSTQQQVVLKIQYPGVAEAIDSDLKLFKHLLKVTNAVPQTKALDDWFNEIRDLLKTEVDYITEANTTKRFYHRLHNDYRYIVPEIIDTYSNNRVLCMSYEEGTHITDTNLQMLSQQRRNALGQAAIEIMLNEIFVWGEMQTDPNFGNYLIRTDVPLNSLAQSSRTQSSRDFSANLSDTQTSLATTEEITKDKLPHRLIDQLILLDFGAIRKFDNRLLHIAQRLMLAGYHNDKLQMIEAMTGYDFFNNLSETVKNNLAEVFLIATEPFRNPELIKNNTSVHDPASKLFDDEGYYHWSASRLHKRLIETSGNAMQSREFNLPPKEFIFISRKFLGAYTFLTVLDAKTNTSNIIKQFITNKHNVPL